MIVEQSTGWSDTGLNHFKMIIEKEGGYQVSWFL